MTLKLVKWKLIMNNTLSFLKFYRILGRINRFLVSNSDICERIKKIRLL